MEQFTRLCKQDEMPDFDTRIVDQIKALGLHIISQNDTTNKERHTILTKLVYFFPDDPSYYYYMAMCEEDVDM